MPSFQATHTNEINTIFFLQAKTYIRKYESNPLYHSHACMIWTDAVTAIKKLIRENFVPTVHGLGKNATCAGKSHYGKLRKV